MLQIRLILMGIAVVAVLGALASASASAITPVFLVCLEKSGSGKKFEERNCSKEDGSGKFELVEVTEFLKINGTGGLSTLKTSLLGAPMSVKCKKSKFSGEVGPKGLSRGEVTYEGCALYTDNKEGKEEELTNCEVPNINFKIVDQLVEKSATEVEDEFKPAMGTTLVDIVFKNKGEKTCTEKGTFPIIGTYNAEAELPATGAKLLRELTFKASGSHLKFNGEDATYEGKVNLDMNNDDSWGVSIP
jgi:hypothetical protein